MTKAQGKAIDRIRELAERYCEGIAFEVKQFEVEDCEYFISVYVVYGMENDEGTLAQVFRRDALLFVGKRGGITYPVTGRSGKQVRKTFHGYSILEAVVAQRI